MMVNICRSKIALDYVGGQWAYFNCGHIETRNIKDGGAVVICSEKAVTNGFTAMKKSVIIEAGKGIPSCETACAQ